jgi:hypothetical protein
MKRLVGDGPRVSSEPILTVSVENVGWSAAEVETASWMQEVRVADMASNPARREKNILNLFIMGNPD